MTGHRLPRVSSKIVTGNTGKVDFHDFRISRKVTSTQNTSKMVPGDPSCLQTDLRWSLGSLGSPPMGSLGLPRVPLPWDPLGSQGSPPVRSLGLPRVPSHGVPWAPKGPLQWDSLGSQGSPPVGSLGLPRVTSHGIPWAL